MPVPARTKAVVAIVACVTLGAGAAAAYTASETGSSVSIGRPVAITSGTTVKPSVTLPTATGAAAICVRDLCLDSIETVLTADGIETTLTRLREAVAQDPARSSGCHPISHQIGRWAATHAATLDEAFTYDDGACLGGYQHGILEGWSLAVSFDELLAEMPEVCSFYQEGWAAGSCTHGLGHAIALQRPGTIIEAVHACDVLAEHQRAGCAGGVLMAYASTSPSQDGLDGFAPLPLDNIDPYTLCSNLGADYDDECYNKLWLFTQRLNISVNELEAACPQEGSLVDACARGIGAGHYYTGAADPEAAFAACRQLDTRLVSGCVAGVAWSNANVWVGANESPDSYRTACSNLPAGTEQACVAAEQEGLDGGR